MKVSEFKRLELDEKRTLLESFLEYKTLEDMLEESLFDIESDNGSDMNIRETGEKVIGAWIDFLSEQDS